MPNWPLMASFTIFVAPLVEELIFRGILYPVLKQTGYPKTGAVGNIVFFCRFSCKFSGPFAADRLAVLLTFLYETTRNLLAPIDDPQAL